jgi:hypothetical protein
MGARVVTVNEVLGGHVRLETPCEQARRLAVREPTKREPSEASRLPLRAVQGAAWRAACPTSAPRTSGVLRLPGHCRPAGITGLDRPGKIGGLCLPGRSTDLRASRPALAPP